MQNNAWPPLIYRRIYRQTPSFTCSVGSAGPRAEWHFIYGVRPPSAAPRWPAVFFFGAGGRFPIRHGVGGFKIKFVKSHLSYGVADVACCCWSVYVKAELAAGRSQGRMRMGMLGRSAAFTPPGVSRARRNSPGSNPNAARERMQYIKNHGPSRTSRVSARRGHRLHKGRRESPNRARPRSAKHLSREPMNMPCP